MATLERMNIGAFCSASTFPCNKEILVFARKLQGNKFKEEMVRKNTDFQGNCKDFL
jgi:membrane protein YqaA with SNARE-associated domain